METKEIKVLMVEPGGHPKVTMLKDDLDSLQKAVSIGADYQGLIEIISIPITPTQVLAFLPQKNPLTLLLVWEAH